ncbi:ABC transporter [Microbacterium sp.]|uniref:ABC transporter n=1 Tax=Microbacterium sp. TaxID=51671 RepID=UPI0039E391EF
MSEPQHDERVDQPQDVDDVVDRVNASLADAEAASRDALEPDTAASVPSSVDDPVEPVSFLADAPADEPTAVHAAADAPTSVFDEHKELSSAFDEPTAVYPAADEPTALYPAAEAPAAPIVPPEPVAEPVVPAAQQPIFVQAPEAPRPRGNRGAVGAIGLLAAVSFGILYLAAALGLRVLSGEADVATAGQDAMAALTSWWLWVPVLVFFVAFWLLGAIINRGRWGVWVVLGLLVGVASYGGHLLGQLFQAPFWALTARQGAEVVEGQLLAPLAIAAFVIGRELTIWFGAWAAARGKRVTELNREAQREYERTLEAGPQVRQG